MARYTWWLTTFTGILALATIGLGLATVGLYLTGEKQIKHNAKVATAQANDMKKPIAVAQSAADAAMLNARAAIGIELTVLRIEPTKFAGGSHRNDDGNLRFYFMVAAIAVTNTGRTRAVPIEIGCDGPSVLNFLPNRPILGALLSKPTRCSSPRPRSL